MLPTRGARLQMNLSVCSRLFAPPVLTALGRSSVFCLRARVYGSVGVHGDQLTNLGCPVSLVRLTGPLTAGSGVVQGACGRPVLAGVVVADQLGELFGRYWPAEEVALGGFGSEASQHLPCFGGFDAFSGDL
jgi:hypothetical protein